MYQSVTVHCLQLSMFGSLTIVFECGSDRRWCSVSVFEEGDMTCRPAIGRIDTHKHDPPASKLLVLFPGIMTVPSGLLQQRLKPLYWTLVVFNTNDVLCWRHLDQTFYHINPADVRGFERCVSHSQLTGWDEMTADFWPWFSMKKT
jgi:hypothetical protein